MRSAPAKSFFLSSSMAWDKETASWLPTPWACTELRARNISAEAIDAILERVLERSRFIGHTGLFRHVSSSCGGKRIASPTFGSLIQRSCVAQSSIATLGLLSFERLFDRL